MRLLFTLCLLFILLTIAFIFGSQNNQIISLNYLIARADISVAVAVSIFTMIGFFLGLLVASLMLFIRKIKPSR